MLVLHGIRRTENAMILGLRFGKEIENSVWYWNNVEGSRSQTWA